MPLSIRLATPEDAETIIAMSKVFAQDVDDPPPGLTAETFRRDGFGHDAWFTAFIAETGAETGDGPIGYAIVNRGFDPQTGTRGLVLADLFVAPARRSQGIGKVMMQAIARHAGEIDARWIVWDVWTKNDRAYAFYEALGAEHREPLFNVSTMILRDKALSALADNGD